MNFPLFVTLLQTVKAMNSNKNGDFTETDGSSYSYEVLAQPSHLLPAGVDKTNREVLHHVLLTTHEGSTEEISSIIINQILSLACDWSIHVTLNEYSPAKTGKYPRIFPNFQSCARCDRDLKDNGEKICSDICPRTRNR